jgi:hypothetical protein
MVRDADAAPRDAVERPRLMRLPCSRRGQRYQLEKRHPARWYCALGLDSIKLSAALRANLAGAALLPSSALAIGPTHASRFHIFNE